jgi:hypothetical protein
MISHPPVSRDLLCDPGVREIPELVAVYDNTARSGPYRDDQHLSPT